MPGLGYDAQPKPLQGAAGLTSSELFAKEAELLGIMQDSWDESERRGVRMIGAGGDSVANGSSIYLGGLIQLLFGLSGRRYQLLNYSTRGSDHVFREGSVNEHWRPPLDSETPSNFMDVEGGAYWRL